MNDNLEIKTKVLKTFGYATDNTETVFKLLEMNRKATTEEILKEIDVGFTGKPEQISCYCLMIDGKIILRFKSTEEMEKIMDLFSCSIDKIKAMKRGELTLKW